MALSDDLDVFFSDSSALSAESGTSNGKGHLDQPTNIAFGDQVLFVDYAFRCKTSDFGTLKSGDAISINSVNYTVRSAEQEDDGLITILSVQKT
mgnify:CR=1 FL=1|tara:strand:- start:2058 stop:2339 length:282 start_codon:yes stop_codon:yes gene_type:complete